MTDKEKTAYEEKMKDASQVVGSIDFEKASTIICAGIADDLLGNDRSQGTLPLIQQTIATAVGGGRKDLKKDLEAVNALTGKTRDELMVIKVKIIRDERDRTMAAFRQVLQTIDTKSPDPERTKAQHCESIFSNVIHNKKYYDKIGEGPSDWKNESLFGRLWAHAILTMEWAGTDKSKKSAPEEALLTNDPVDSKWFVAPAIHSATFDRAEVWLLANNYIDQQRKWQKTKQDFAALIQFLIEEKIFKLRQSGGKINQGSRGELRQLFESRYGDVSISEQFKPSQIKKTQMDQFTPGLSDVIKNHKTT